MVPGREPTLRHGDLDSSHLAEIMKALANPVRIDLLKALQSAKTLGEIRLEPRRHDSMARTGRSMNRVTTRRHLDLLLELGLARSFRRIRDGRALDHYVIDHGQLFALLEELRQLILIRPQEEVADGTVPAPWSAPMSIPGAKLALVNGVGEGRVFEMSGAGIDRWAIGRHQGAAIHLEYDPYVSLENSEVTKKARGYAVRDLNSRNGTFVNWERLAAGEWRPLVSGDLLGVGRSVLVFRNS